MFARFTDSGRTVMTVAMQEAKRLGKEFADTTHLLIAIIQEGSSVAAQALKEHNVTSEKLQQEAEKLATPTKGPDVVLGQIPFAPQVKQTIEQANEISQALGHAAVAPDHLFLGLLRTPQESTAAQVLRILGLNVDQLQDGILSELRGDAH